jgi:hypothetical protein
MTANRSYAVVWSDNGATGSGRLEVQRDAVELHGREHRLLIPFADLAGASIARTARDRLCGLPVLALRRRSGDPVRIASLEGVGALQELAAQVAALSGT